MARIHRVRTKQKNYYKSLPCPQVELQIQLRLRGPPTACTVVPGIGSLVVGDAAGGFTVLEVTDGPFSLGCDVYPLATDVLPCHPCHLAFISHGRCLLNPCAIHLFVSPLLVIMNTGYITEQALLSPCLPKTSTTGGCWHGCKNCPASCIFDMKV